MPETFIYLMHEPWLYSSGNLFHLFETELSIFKGDKTVDKCKSSHLSQLLSNQSILLSFCAIWPVLALNPFMQKLTH